MQTPDDVVPASTMDGEDFNVDMGSSTRNHDCNDEPGCGSQAAGSPTKQV